MRNIIGFIAIIGALALCSCDKKENSSSSSGAGAALRIAVVPKGSTHEHWKSVHAGAEQAAAELGVQIMWKAPLKENDRAQQIQIVEQLVSENYNALLLAPLDDKALVKPVREAAAKKIPVVIFDSALKADAGKDFVSYVSTDNHKGGVLAGQELARILDHKGKIVLLRYDEGSAATMEREAGFLEVIKANPQIQILVENRYAGATVDSAQIASMNLLDQLRNADGVFCPNESSTRGMLLALDQAGLKGKLKFVGFDASPALVESLRKNELQALIAQNPRKMGYEGVKIAVAAIHGQPFPQVFDTGVQLITRENLETPEVKNLLGL